MAQVIVGRVVWAGVSMIMRHSLKLFYTKFTYSCASLAESESRQSHKSRLSPGNSSKQDFYSPVNNKIVQL